MTGIKKLKDEIINLKKKEIDVGELTDGQKKRIEINENKLNHLYEKYEALESNFKVSLTSKEEAEDLEIKFDRKLVKDLDSEHEYFDRTNISTMKKNQEDKNKQIVAVTENYETLKIKLEYMI